MSTALPKRLFDLVDALQGRGLRTTVELARELGVSERTVRRDIGRLLDLDIPVETQPGRAGGVSLPAGALLPAVRFTDDELLALVMGLKAVAASGDEVLERAASRSIRRLETVLSPSVRGRIRALQEVLTPGISDAAQPVSAPSQHVIALAEASSRGERLVLSYRDDGDDVTVRKIDPYGLAKIGPWYVVAYCHLRQDLRTFRVDRIRSISKANERFARPEEFDAYRYVSDAIAMAPMHGDLICRAWLGTDLQTASRRLAFATILLQPVDDGVMMTVRTNRSGLEWVILHLLRLRCEVRVEGPSEFWEALRAMTSRLGSSDGSAPA